MKKLISLLLVIVLSLTFSVPEVSFAATIKLNKSFLELHTEETYSLKLSGATGTVKWTSNKESIATVTSKGKVTAQKEGTATIIATYKNKKYKSIVTVLSNKKVDVIYTALNIDDTATIDDYAVQYKEENPDLLDVKVYDDEHIIVTMYDVDRQNAVNEISKNLETYLQSFITDIGLENVITDIESDPMMQNITLQVKGKDYDNFLTSLTTVLGFGILSDMIQAINLVDIADRKFNLTVIDNSTGDILYPAN